jgi:hypothetical protein
MCNPEQFLRWAATPNLLDSDGGNPKAKVWICGIEPNLLDEEHLFRQDLPLNRQPQDDRIPSWTEDWPAEKDRTTFPYDRMVARLLLALGPEQELNPSPGIIADYMRTSLYRNAANGKAFKLNLYPLSASGQDTWEERHRIATNYPLKLQYQAWCVERRFPKIRRFAHQHMPRVIVATGKTTMKRHFLVAFMGNAHVFDMGDRIPIPGDPLIELESFPLQLGDQPATLLVTPFFKDNPRGPKGFLYHNHIPGLVQIIQGRLDIDPMQEHWGDPKRENGP